MQTNPLDYLLTQQGPPAQQANPLHESSGEGDGMGGGPNAMAQVYQMLGQLAAAAAKEDSGKPAPQPKQTIPPTFRRSPAATGLVADVRKTGQDLETAKATTPTRKKLTPTEGLVAAALTLFGGNQGAALAAGYGQGKMAANAQDYADEERAGAAKEDSLLSRLKMDQFELERVDAEDMLNYKEQMQQFDQQRKESQDDQDKVRSAYINAKDGGEVSRTLREWQSKGYPNLPTDDEVVQHIAAIDGKDDRYWAAQIAVREKQLQDGNIQPQEAASIIGEIAAMREKAGLPVMSDSEKQGLKNAAESQYRRHVADDVWKWVDKRNGNILSTYGATQGLNETQARELVRQVRSQIAAQLKAQPALLSAGWTEDSLTAAILDPGQFVGPSRRIVESMQSRAISRDRLEEAKRNHAAVETRAWANYSRQWDQWLFEQKGGDETKLYQNLRQSAFGEKRKAGADLVSAKRTFDTMKAEYDRLQKTDRLTKEQRARMDYLSKTLPQWQAAISGLQGSVDYWESEAKAQETNIAAAKAGSSSDLSYLEGRYGGGQGIPGAGPSSANPSGGGRAVGIRKKV